MTVRRETSHVVVSSVMSAALIAGSAHAAQPAVLEEIVVTASRAPTASLDVAASITRIGSDEIARIGATHYAETLNRIPGVYVQRGSGQESLPAIRSPVLTGAGSCGAFLLLEDGMPLRPVGFCNVNEMFETNAEQARAVEVVRGPGPAIYGANAVHGIVNVISPAVRDLPGLAASFTLGAADFRRAELSASVDAGANELGAYGLFTRDGGFRADSGYDEGKFNLLLDRGWRDGQLRVRAVGTVLNQETAGFVRGLDSYRDPTLRVSNPNPEAFRDAWSTRLSAQWSRSSCDGCDDDVRVVARRSRMEFLQHFLLGKPLERNGQTSLAASASIARPFGARATWRAGADVEWADMDLLESQSGPTLEGSAAARAIRPAGRHYDYAVESLTAGAHVALDWHFAPRWQASAALRVERTRYAYDNRMIDGNTAENGVPCAFGGCLYSRPADRDDSFANVAPKIELRFAPTDSQRLYASWSRGFRPPETTELYRLQRQQRIADLDSERMDAAEIGWKFSSVGFDAALAAFALEKNDVILRDANAFNVSGGRTTHRGIEYEWQWRFATAWRLGAAGSVAWHRYGFSRAVDGGETIVAGREIDTAPRNVHGLRLGFAPRAGLDAELEVQSIGRYFLDAANAREYPGHVLANLRVSWAPTPSLSATLRVINLADRDYADRADFANGEYRYFPGAGRSIFVELGWTRVH